MKNLLHWKSASSTFLAVTVSSALMAFWPRFEHLSISFLAVWLLFLLSLAFVFLQTRRQPRNPFFLLVVAVITFLCFVFVWQTSVITSILNFLALYIFMSILLKTINYSNLTNPFELEYFWTIFEAPVQGVWRFVETIIAYFKNFNDGKQVRFNWIRIVVSVVISLPILAIFIALFSAADENFNKFIGDFLLEFIENVPINILQFIGYFILFSIILSVNALGLSPKLTRKISYARSEADRVEEDLTDQKPLFTFEISLIIGLVAALFTLFVAFQFSYLFGDSSEENRTIAENARSGFFELLAVSTLAFILIKSAESIITKTRLQTPVTYRIPAGYISALTAFISFSAFRRLSNYIDYFGWTNLRLISMWAIVLIFCYFVLLTIKYALSGMLPRNWFPKATLLILSIFTVFLMIVQPDGLIARMNYDRAEELQGESKEAELLDVVQILSLSSDALETHKTLQETSASEFENLINQDYFNDSLYTIIVNGLFYEPTVDNVSDRLTTAETFFQEDPKLFYSCTLVEKYSGIDTEMDREDRSTIEFKINNIRAAQYYEAELENLVPSCENAWNQYDTASERSRMLNIRE